MTVGVSGGNTVVSNPVGLILGVTIGIVVGNTAVSVATVEINVCGGVVTAVAVKTTSPGLHPIKQSMKQMKTNRLLIMLFSRAMLTCSRLVQSLRLNQPAL
jgi:galactitol-specific phosphotransferase system IIC component